VVEGLPALLTVEEAGSYLRVGRTKAYAMAREWRATGGRSGLPVVDFGNVLRVPRHALEEMIGTALGAPRIEAPAPVSANADWAAAQPTPAPDIEQRGHDNGLSVAEPTAPAAAISAPDETRPQPAPLTRRPRKGRDTSTQLDLFGSASGAG
jgi:hypothetical protein